MNIQRLPGNMLYIEDAFPKHKEFLAAIEEQDSKGDLEEIIPKWKKWIDGSPKIVNARRGWETVFVADDDFWRGQVKNLDWDLTLNYMNSKWPRVEVDYDYLHTEAYKIIEMIDKPYLASLDIWYKEFNQKPLKYVSKNYCIKKYRIGGALAPHVDRNLDNPSDQMDWTALIYLNDDYEGGELFFPDLDITLKPSAGSILIFPCENSHMVHHITAGNKYFIFMYIHTKYGISTALNEKYTELYRQIDLLQ